MSKYADIDGHFSWAHARNDRCHCRILSEGKLARGVPEVDVVIGHAHGNRHSRACRGAAIDHRRAYKVPRHRYVTKKARKTWCIAKAHTGQLQMCAPGLRSRPRSHVADDRRRSKGVYQTLLCEVASIHSDSHFHAPCRVHWSDAANAIAGHSGSRHHGVVKFACQRCALIQSGAATVKDNHAAARSWTVSRQYASGDNPLVVMKSKRHQGCCSCGCGTCAHHTNRYRACEHRGGRGPAHQRSCAGGGYTQSRTRCVKGAP